MCFVNDECIEELINESQVPRVPEPVRHLQRASAPVCPLQQPLGPARARDAHGVVTARACRRLVDVVVRHLAVRRVNDL